MAGLNQTLRKSLGGRAPRKQLRDATTAGFLFKDHAGQTYTVVDTHRTSNAKVFKLGIQLYCLGKLESTPTALGLQFLGCDAISGTGNARNWWPRVDVYTGCGSVEECIEHHRREKEFRKKAVQDMRQEAVKGLSEEDAYEKLITEVRGKEPLPHIVPSWCPSAKFWREGDYSARYRSWILVITEKCSSWEDVMSHGLLGVSFDLDHSPAMDTDMWYDNVDEHGPLEGENGWVYVEKTNAENSPPVSIKLLCVRKQPWDTFLTPEEANDIDRINEVLHGWKTPGHDTTLFDAWGDILAYLRDCTYRRSDCDGCTNYEPHERCEVELSEHYFDDDGQCIACRRTEEYRRRSKRIAAKQVGE